MLRSLRTGFVRRTSLGLFVAAAAITTACSTENSVGPSSNGEVAARSGLVSNVLGDVGGLLKSQALIRSQSLAAPITRSIKLNGQSGTIAIPEAGFTLTIPANATNGAPITISVTALAGKAVAYTFEPHGIQFANSLTFTQDLSGTTWNNNILRLIYGGYFANDSQVNTTTGVSLINEKLPVLVFGKSVQMQLWHFSGYMVSMD